MTIDFELITLSIEQKQPMKTTLKHKQIENIIYLAVWTILVTFVTFLSERNDEIQWYKVMHDLASMLPFFLIFFINNKWLTPHLLFKKKYIWYFSITGILILGLSHPALIRQLHELIPLPDNLQPLGPNVRPHGSGFSPLSRPPRGQNLETFRAGMAPPGKGIFIRYLNTMLLAAMVVGFNTAIKQAGRLVNEERLRHQLSEEKLQAELAFLKHQISPHFLMNTLNNIHALVELAPKDAQHSIVGLSHMLRYLLYEKEDKKTSLEKEIEFIKSYTNLMRMRYSDELEVKLKFPEVTPKISIPPFVFITILENAFKHGAAINKNCFIHLSITVKDNYLVVDCSNCKQAEVSLPQAESSGIGLVNTRKRLDLYYGDKYIWEVNQSDKIYSSIIKLPI